MIKGKSLLCFCILFCSYTFTHVAYSQEINNPSTFHSTALRFLDASKQKLIEQNWNAAYVLAETALQYDSSIADLYFLKALCLLEKNNPTYEVIENLEQSLDDTVYWYQYTEEAARLLLAKLYVGIKKPDESIALLDLEPQLTNSEALYIRARAYYVIGDLSKARATVLLGATQYPLDRRFDELFYTQEYEIQKNTQRDDTGDEEELEIDNISVDNQVLSLDSNELETSSNIFILPIENELSILIPFFNDRVEQFSQDNTMLLLYAAIFSSDPEVNNRLIRALNTKGEKHPLFAILALIVNIIDEQQAFMYMQPFFNTIEYSILLDFISILQDEQVIHDVRSHFGRYEGKILIDTNGDLEHELSIFYERGRPSNIIYDENQDGMLTWEMTNDYGEPKTVYLFSDKKIIEYDTWPYVKNVTDNFHADNFASYNMISGSLSLPLVDFVVEDEFQNILSIPFYTPIVLEEKEVVDLDLFNTSYLIDAKTAEFNNSRVRFTLLDGIVKSATYTTNEKPYAYAHFENGIPVFRNVDKDNNGSYEVVEIFSQTTDETLETEKVKDELFVFDYVAQGSYIQKVLVDLNNDGFDDFTEEYADGVRIASWDRNSDGQWDVQFLQHNDASTQEVFYVHPLTNEVKSVLINNGAPIFANGKEVIEDETYDFYWIGENVGSAHAEKIITELSLNTSGIALMVTDLLWNKDKEQFMRIVGIKNGEMYFGEVFYE